MCASLVDEWGVIMQAYRVKTVVPPNGEVRLKQLPFRPGEIIEVIVLARSLLPNAMNPSPLKNTVTKYEEPTEPVGVDDWAALQ
jgi:hypothetical protein